MLSETSHTQKDKDPVTSLSFYWNLKKPRTHRSRRWNDVAGRIELQTSPWGGIGSGDLPDEALPWVMCSALKIADRTQLRGSHRQN
jgi:hypothetical protein